MGMAKGEMQMENDNKIDLILWIQKTFHVFHKTWKVLLFLIMFFCAFMTIQAVIRFDPVYESKITFSVVKEYDGNSNFTYNKDATDKLSASFLTIIQSDLMVDAICEDLQVSQIPASFRVERIGSTNLFSVFAQSGNPENAKAVLDSLTQNYKQISKVALNDASLNIIEAAELSSVPVNSVHYLNVLVKGAITGFIIYLFYALGYALLRRTILKPQDIKTVLHSYCLCSIPKIKLIKGKRLLISDAPAHVDHLKDAFHKIRMEMENEKKEKDNCIFMITSAMAHEGKSMVSSNLAISLAKKGYRVLLVDLDLRNPTQKSTFLIDSNETEVQLGHNTFYMYKKVKDLSLDLVVTADVQQDASEALSQPQIKIWLEEMRSQYDFVLLDTPPVNLMADTAVIADYADTAILVIKEDFASVQTLREAMEALLNENQNILGCVLNQCHQLGRISSYYGYRLGKYGYGYGYHYGYGYGYHNKEKRL